MANGITSKLRSRKLEKDSPSKPPLLRPKLESSVVAVKDLAEQPSSPLILLVGAGRPTYYAIDHWSFKGDSVVFELNNKIVYVSRKEGVWAIVSRDVATSISEKEYTAEQIADSKRVEEYYKSLDPEGWKQAEQVVQSGGLEALLGGGGTDPHLRHVPKDDGKPVPGQYL